MGQSLPRSVSKSNVSPTLCPWWQTPAPFFSTSVKVIFGLLTA